MLNHTYILILDCLFGMCFYYCKIMNKRSLSLWDLFFQEVQGIYVSQYSFHSKQFVIIGWEKSKVMTAWCFVWSHSKTVFHRVLCSQWFYINLSSVLLLYFYIPWKCLLFGQEGKDAHFCFHKQNSTVCFLCNCLSINN